MNERSDRFGAGDFRPVHRGPLDPWPEVGYDVALHLLDRQIVDVAGLLVGKVDDVELTEAPDGALVPTGLLVGAAAWLPRVGDRLGRWLATRHRQMRVADAERGTAAVVDLALVADVTSEVHLVAEREGLLRRRLPDATTRHRVGDLLGMPVRGWAASPSWRAQPRVLDARLDADPGGAGTHRVAALVVGKGRPGSLLGYERRDAGGPWVVRSVVRWLHRDSRLVRLGDDVEIDWEEGEVRIGERGRIESLDRGTAPAEARAEEE